LNQIIEIWSYESIEHRTRIQAEPTALRNWPPATGEVVVDRRTLVLKPAPFSPPIIERKLGGIYEFRFYTYRKGAFKGIIERWAPSIERRVKFSRLVGVWYREDEDVGHLVHVWALSRRQRLARYPPRDTQDGLLAAQRPRRSARPASSAD
jgi:hypothetical protein